jgi:hypothetical protein
MVQRPVEILLGIVTAVTARPSAVPGVEGMRLEARKLTAGYGGDFCITDADVKCVEERCVTASSA